MTRNEIDKSEGKRPLPKFEKMWAIPAGIYLLLFVVMTWPLVMDFSSHFFTDDSDGLGMIWNVWWVEKALTELYQSPWHTDYLFYPAGVSLYTHTLTPFNGFLSVLIRPFMPLVQTYNLLVILTFVFGGLTSFWLSFYVTRAWWPSVVAGFIFAFSNYHFAHTPGHLNLASIQWIPLYLLCLLVLLDKPSNRMGLYAALSLFAVILCDYYYFLFCALATVIVLVWSAARRGRAWFFTDKYYRLPMGIFAGASLATSGVIVYKLLSVMGREKLVGTHESWQYSTDLLSPFVYGSALRFSQLTEGFWRRLPGNTAENSMYMGLSVVLLVVLAWVWRRRIDAASPVDSAGAAGAAVSSGDAGAAGSVGNAGPPIITIAGGVRLWFAVLLFFGVMSLGPGLQVWGRTVPYLPMPYRLLELLIPPLKISGCPGRMMVMVMLSAAVISALSLDLLMKTSRRAMIFAAAVLVVMFVEFLPAQIKPFRAVVPEYVTMLRNLKDDGAVIDLVNDPTYAMYCAMVHDRPLWTGKIARLPQRLADLNEEILATARRGDIARLHQGYGFKYAILDSNRVYNLETDAFFQADSVYYKFE